MENDKLVEITLDKKRNLLFNYGAMQIFENAVGKSFQKFLSSISTTGITIDDTTALLFAGLKHEDKNLTLEKCESFIIKDNFLEMNTHISNVQSKLMEAMTINSAKSEKVEEPKNAKSSQK